jgi:NAD(P)H dehydrogenase (quinone)
MTNIVVVYHSGFGHTAKQAQAVAEGAGSVASVTAKLLKVEDADKSWDLMAAADGIIFGSPTYMGNVSGPFKMFMDASSKAWFGQQWKDKIAAGFTNSGGLSGDKLNTLETLSIFAAQHSMIWVSQGIMPSVYTKDGRDLNRLGSWLGAMSVSTNESPEVTPPPADLETAREFGKRVATATVRWMAGKSAATKAA